MSNRNSTLSKTGENNSSVFFTFKNTEIDVFKKINISKSLFDRIYKEYYDINDYTIARDVIIVLHILGGKSQHSSKLQKYVDRYKDILNELLYSGFISCESKYSAGYKTNLYTVNDDIATEDRFYNLRYENELERSILERLAKVRFNKIRLDNKLVNYDGVYFDPEIDLDQLIADNSTTNEDAVNYANMVRNIKTNKVKVVKNYICGRHFSDFNMLPKFLRQHLMKNGHHLVEIDVKACHPNLLVTVLSEQLRILEERTKNINDFGYSFDPAIHVELWEYNQLLKGDFYSNFISDTGIEIERNELKTAFLVYLNSGKDIKLAGSASDVSRAFCSRFPHLGATIRYLNSRTAINGAKQNFLSIELQKMEGQIMSRVIGNLVREYKDKVVIGIHDALLTEHDFLPIAYGETLRVFSSFGVEVKLETKTVSGHNEFPSLPILTIPSCQDFEQNEPIIGTNQDLIGTNQDLIGTNQDLIGTNQDLIGTKKEKNMRNKRTKIGTTKDGRFFVKYKNTRYNSKKSESYEQFRERIISMFPEILLTDSIVEQKEQKPEQSERKEETNVLLSIIQKELSKKLEPKTPVNYQDDFSGMISSMISASRTYTRANATITEEFEDENVY